jgi:hypothetical protein
MYNDNLKLFAMKNPKASVLLSFVEKVSQQPLNRSEIVNWAKSLSLDNVDFLVQYGLRMGVSYDVLKDSRRHLIYIEDDLGEIERFLECKEAHSILQDPQVHLFYIENSEDGLEVLRSLVWAAYGKNMRLAQLPGYRSNTFEDVKARIDYELSDLHMVLEEYVGFGVSFFRNFWKNLFKWPGSYKGNLLQNGFKGIPAICVAAGPSLEKHLKQLQSLRDKALIFSGGSSVNALVDGGVRPHFGAGIDPNPLQYIRFREALAFDVPFFFRNRLLPASLDLIHGPRLYLKGGDGYNISDWFEERCKIPGAIIGGGHSVANFIIEIAEALGCNPIILVGYDLAFGKELKRYAPGVESAHDVALDAPIAWKDHEGNPIHTAWKWLLEAKWIEDFKEEKPNLTLINATEGGLGLQNIPHSSLQEVTDTYLSIPRDLDSLVHTAIQEAGEITCDPKALYKGCSEMYDSLEKVKNLLEELATIANYEDPDALLLLGQLKEEIAYKYLLEVFDRMRAKLEYYRLHFIDHPALSDDYKKKFEIELLRERYIFLRDTAVVNQLLIAQSIAHEQALGHDVSAFSPNSKVLWS